MGNLFDYLFLTLRLQISVNVDIHIIQSKCYAHFLDLMHFSIVFRGDITPKIFYQCVFSVLACIFYAYTHVIWSTVSGLKCPPPLPPVCIYIYSSNSIVFFVSTGITSQNDYYKNMNSHSNSKRLNDTPRCQNDPDVSSAVQHQPQQVKSIWRQRVMKKSPPPPPRIIFYFFVTENRFYERKYLSHIHL